MSERTRVFLDRGGNTFRYDITDLIIPDLYSWVKAYQPDGSLVGPLICFWIEEETMFGKKRKRRVREDKCLVQVSYVEDRRMGNE